MDRYFNLPLPQLEQEIAHLRTLPLSHALAHALIAYCWHLQDADDILLDTISEVQIVSEYLDFPLGLAYCNLLHIQLYLAARDSDSIKILFQATVMQDALADSQFRGFYLLVEAVFHNIHNEIGLGLVNLLEATYRFESEHNLLGLVGAYDALGWSYGLLKDGESELTYRTQAYEVARQLESEGLLLAVIFNFLDALARFGKIEEGIPYLEQGEMTLARYRTTHHGPLIPLFEARLLLFRALLMIRHKRLNEAEMLLKRAQLVPFPSPIPPPIVIRCYDVECDLATLQGDIQKAIEVAAAGLSVAEDFKCEGFQKSFIKRLVGLYRRQQNFERALCYLEQGHALASVSFSWSEITRIEAIQKVCAYDNIAKVLNVLQANLHGLQALTERSESTHVRSSRSYS